MDEGFGAGDTSFYEKAQERMSRFLSSAGTLLLASHSDELLRRFCRRGLVFDGGRLVFSGPLETALDYYHRNHGPVTTIWSHDSVQPSLQTPSGLPCFPRLKKHGDAPPGGRHRLHRYAFCAYVLRQLLVSLNCFLSLSWLWSTAQSSMCRISAHMWFTSVSVCGVEWDQFFDCFGTQSVEHNHAKFLIKYKSDFHVLDMAFQVRLFCSRSLWYCLHLIFSAQLVA